MRKSTTQHASTARNCLKSFGAGYLRRSLGFAAVILATLAASAFGQDDTPPSDVDTPDTNSAPVEPKLEISVDESAPVEFLDVVDGGFARAVNYMAMVLFYRVMPDEQTYIETNHVEKYYRARGASGPFGALASGQTYSQLSLSQAEALMARSKLELGIDDPETEEPRPYRDGLW